MTHLSVEQLVALREPGVEPGDQAARVHLESCDICRSIRSYREEGSLWGWIRTIAASKALMRLRRNKYRDTDELHDEVMGRIREDHHLRMDLEAALERLPEVSRAVVWLHDVEGYTHEEIARMMGKTTSFSKSQLARAHARLRRWLGEEAMV